MSQNNNNDNPFAIALNIANVVEEQNDVENYLGGNNKNALVLLEEEFAVSSESESEEEYEISLDSTSQEGFLGLVKNAQFYVSDSESSFD